MKDLVIKIGFGVVLFIIFRFIISFMSSFPSAFIVNAETTAIVNSIILLGVIITMTSLKNRKSK